MSEWPKCPSCGARQEPNYEFDNVPPPHYAVKRCSKCNRHLGFLAKPDADKARRPAAHRKLVKKSGLDYCEMCLIREDRLPPGEMLVGHHIEEYADGADCENENVLVLCLSCHTLTHWRRTEIKHHVGKEGQHHVERSEVPPVVEGPAAVGDVENSAPWNEGDEGPDTDERDTGEFDGPDDLDQR